MSTISYVNVALKIETILPCWIFAIVAICLMETYFVSAITWIVGVEENLAMLV